MTRDVGMSHDHNAGNNLMPEFFMIEVLDF